MTNYGVNFYKGKYGKGTSKTLPSDNKGIIFNQSEHVIYVDGTAYGNATDVTFENGILTITYSDGRTPVTLDFNDTASATATLAVFERLNKVISGSDSLGDSDVDYTDTNYLKTVNNLIGADKQLDAEIKNVNDKIDAMDTTETISSEKDGVVTLHKTLSEEDGVVNIADSDSNEITFAKVATTGKAEDVSYDDTTSKMGTEAVTVDNVQTAIEVLDSRLEDLESLDTFDTVVSKDAATTPENTEWTSGSETVTGTLKASADTMHKIYLVPDTSTTAEHSGTYNEYISVRQGSGDDATYSWELIGNTKADLTGYVKTIVVNGKEYAVAENSTKVTLGDAITKITGETAIAGGDENYIAVTATTADASNGEKETTISSTLKIQAVANASDSAKGIAESSDVKNYVDGKFDNLDAELDASDSYVEVSLKQTDGKINTLGVDVDYATISTSKEEGKDTEMSSTDGIVIGSDVTKIASFVNTRISEEIAKLDSDMTSDGAAVAKVEVKEEDGKISDVIVTTIGADVKFITDESDNEPHLEATISTGAVLGSDIPAIKSYIDAKSSASSTVVEADDSDAIVVTKSIDTTDGHTTYTVGIVWSEFGE